MKNGSQKYIGRPFQVVEDRRFVRGKGRYINDVELPGMLHMTVAASPRAHARILSIDVEAARNAPGVVAVLTGQNLAERTEPIPQNLVLPHIRWYALAVDKVRYAGEWVAAIVATSRAAAEDAADLVTVEYEDLPPVVDPEEAMQPGASLVHDGAGSNVAWHDEFTWGEVDAAFEKAAHVFRYRYRWNRHSGVPLETFGAVAALDPSGQMLELWASHQTPSLDHEIARVLRWPSHRVRVHQDVDIGGSYGVKRGNKQIHLTAFAAVATGRPVKFIEDRLQNMTAGDSHGPDRVFRIALAANDDGVVDAITIEILDDVGAYVGRGALQFSKPITAVVGPYRIRNVRYGGYAIVTNKTNQAPYRGFGQGPHNFILERSLDRMARALGIDRVEIRCRNYIAPDAFPYRIPSGSEYDSGNYPGAMNLALQTSAFQRIEREQARARAEGKLVGIGVAGCLEPSGGNQAIFAFMNPHTVGMAPETVRLHVDQEGHVVATIGFQSAGQGHESMVTQILCDELGVAPEKVTVVRGDSLSGILGATPIGSRMTLMLTKALLQAVAKVKAKMIAIAAFNLDAHPDDVEWQDGKLFIRDIPSQSLALIEIAQIAYRHQTRLPDDMEPGLTETAVAKVMGGGQGLDEQRRMKFGFPSYAFSVHVPVVEIDPETLQVKLEQYHVVHDCGTVINPLTVAGFVYGGIAHGIGAALFEQFSYSPEGQPLAGSLMDYLMPTIAEVPPIELAEQVTPSPLHPYGSKGTAEGGYMTAPAAIASAVEDALQPLGIEITEIPLSPDRLFDLLREHKARLSPADTH